MQEPPGGEKKKANYFRETQSAEYQSSIDLVESTINTFDRDNSGASASRLSPGEIFAHKYEVLSVLGEGGMGVIYKVREPMLDKILAVKVLNRDCVDANSFRRFQTEARAAGALNHPNLITVHMLDVFDGRPFMVIDYVEGDSLSSLLKSQGALSIDNAINIAIQICDGIACAHAKGVLHRDLKPSNIMLTPEGTGMHVKVVDFGIAKVTNTDALAASHELTRTGEIFGSPLYMSPEQAAGRVVDQRSDIYSLGCLLFEALTGEPPYRGANPLETMYLRIQSKAPLLAEKAPSTAFFPDWLEAVLEKALAIDPAERFQTMAEFSQALLSVQDSISSGEKGSSQVRTKVQSGISQTIAANRQGGAISTKTRILANAALLFGGMLILLYFFGIVQNKKTESSKAAIKAIMPESSLDAQLAALGLKTNSQFADLERKSPDAPLLTSKDLECLLSLPLTRLNLNHQAAIGDHELATIAKIHTLKVLSLKGSKISSLGLRQLLALTQLKHLDISECENIDDSVGAILAQFKKLDELDLFRCRNLGDKCLAGLKPLNLTLLYLRGTQITNHGLREITNMPLITLSLGENDQINDSSLELVSKSFPALEYLNMTHCDNITNKGLAFLSSLQHLNDLRIDQANISDCVNLAGVTSLHTLLLNSDPVDDQGIRALTKLPQLSDLNLRETKITDASIQYFKDMPALKKLNVMGTKLTKKGISQLKEMHLKSLKK